MSNPSNHILPRRVRASLVVAGLSVVLLAAACSDDSDSDSGSRGGEQDSGDIIGDSVGGRGSAASTEGTQPANPELAAMLLTLEDMPDGWAELPPVDDDEGLCVLSDAYVVYAEDPHTGPGLAHEVIDTDDPADAFTAAADAINGCDVERNGVHYQFTALNVPQVGDESQGFRAMVTDLETESTYSRDLVLYRSGDAVGIVSVFDRWGDAADLLSEYASIAAERGQQ